jgi:hypothetical protein
LERREKERMFNVMLAVSAKLTLSRAITGTSLRMVAEQPPKVDIMSNSATPPKRAGDGVRPAASESRNWPGGFIRHAPKLTKLWGSYRAFLTVITLGALVALPFVRDGGVIALTIVVLAAMWSPLIAKKFGILD